MKQYNPAILRQVEARRKRKDFSVIDHKHALYRTVQVLYILAFAWLITMQVFYLIGTYLQLTDSTAGSVKVVELVTITVATAAVIAGFVLMMKRIYIAAAIFNVVPLVLSAVTFFHLMQTATPYVEGAVKATFYWRHGVPALIMLLAAAVLCFFGLRAAYLLRRDYKAEEEKIYLRYQDRFTGVNSIEWEQFLATYDSEKPE